MNESAIALIVECRHAFERSEFDAVLRITGQLSISHSERPEVWRVRAEAYVGQGKHSDALSSYVRAIALLPFDAHLRVRYARALGQCSLHRQARAQYDAAFKLQPSSLSALHGVVGYRNLDPDDPALTGVKLLARNQQAPVPAQGFACFLLGRIYSASGRDTDAFEYYELANELCRLDLQDEIAMRGPKEFVSWWAKGLEVMAGRSRSTPNDASLRCSALLIVGLPRSGKSLVEHLLKCHPSFAAGGELGGLHEAVDSQNGTPPGRLKALQENEQDLLVQAYCRALAESGNPSALFVLDTSPANLWDLGYLGHLHPEVPVILCKRNPLDLGASIYFKKFKHGHAYSYDQAELGAMLATAEKAIDYWRRVLPNPMQVVDYERLVSQPQEVRETLCRWLCLDPGLCRSEGGTGDVMDGGPVVHTSHSSPSYGPFVTDLIGCGSRFAEQLKPMMDAFRRAIC